MSTGAAISSQVALHRQEIGRGILLLLVFYVHALLALVDHLGGPQAAPIEWFQNRLLAAQVALFFVLAGQTATRIGRQPFRTILCRSLALLILAAVSHIPAVVLFDLWGYERLTFGQFLSDLLKPILLGTGYYTAVPWFFVVLALTRLLVYALVSHTARFVISLLAVAAVAWAGGRLGLTDNLYEWRNLPVALPLFLLGMHLPKGWSPPRWMMVTSLIGLPVTAFANSPGTFHWPCFNCDRLFVQQPLVGEMGLPPLLYLSLGFGYCLLAYMSAALVGSWLGRAIRPFGRNSLYLLLMHGWVIVTIYPFAAQFLPHHEQWFMCIGLALILPPAHWLLFIMLRRPIFACWKLANQLSQQIVYGGAHRSQLAHSRIEQRATNG